MISVPMDIGSHVKAKQGVAPFQDTATTTHNGTGFDRTGYESCVLVVDATVTGAPTLSLAAKIQDSADNSTFADFTPNTGSAAITALTASGIATVNVNLLGARQYIRVNMVDTITGGTSPTVTSVAHVLLGGAVSEPA